MRRRAFLSVGVTAGVSVIAGCTSSDEISITSSEPIRIADVAAPSQIAFDATAEIEVRLVNETDDDVTDTLYVEVDGEQIHTIDVTLAGGETTTVTTTLDATALDEGERTLLTSTSDDSQQLTLTIEGPEPARLGIHRVQFPATVGHDEEFTVDVDLENTGDVSGTERITILLDDEEYAAQQFTLGGGETDTLTFELDAIESFTQRYDVQVVTAHDTYESTLLVDHPNPYDKPELVVSLEEEVETELDIHAVVEEALAYWEEHAETYAGYPVEYEYRPEADDPDVRIMVVDNIPSCGVHAGEVMGCATLVTDTAPDVADIEIVAGYPRNWLLNTLKHELGHTLGLTHDDEPAPIMSNDIEDIIPDYAERTAAIETYNDGITAWNRGVNAWDDAVDNLHSNDSRAESWAETARSDFETARNRFEMVRTAGDDLDEDDVVALADEARSAAHYMVEASRSLRNAAQAYQRSDIRTGNRYVTDSNQYVDTSESYAITSAVRVERAFGFPVRD